MKWLAGLALVLVIGSSCTAPSQSPPPAVRGTADSILADLKSGKVGKWDSLVPVITYVDDDGFSYAMCPRLMMLDTLYREDSPDMRWTLAHEWGHLVGCQSGTNGILAPPGFPASTPPVNWAWTGTADWIHEQWADCVALYLTGIDGATPRDYPECRTDQLSWTRTFFGR